MPFKLSGLMLNRVDLCPDGSNPDANIVLFKSKEGRMPTKKKTPTAKKSVKKTPADSRSKKKQEAEEEEEEEEDDAVAKSDDDEDDDEDAEDDSEEEADEDEDEEVSKGGRRKEDKEKDKSRKKKGVKKAAADEDDDEEEDEEDEDDDVAKSADEDDDDEDDEADDEDALDEKVLKSLNPAVRMLVMKQNEKLRRLSKSARRAERTALVEKDRRETLEYVEKAKKDIPNLTGTAEEKAEMLKALYSGQPIVKKIADRIVKLLKSGDAAVKNLLMSETGSRRARTEEEEDALSQLRDKRDDIMKADKKLTKEQAFEKACQDNPELFDQYRVEKARARQDH